MEFQEKFKIDTFFSTGSTVAVFTQYYDMKGYRRVDFLFEGLVNLPASGVLGATDFQDFTLAAYQASDSTGGGSSAISSATAVVGKNSATGISTSQKCREGFIDFSTISGSAALTVNVGTAAYVSASIAAPAAAMTWVSGASAQASVAKEAFVSMFNSTYNTATAVAGAWIASTVGVPAAWCRILPKDPDSTYELHLGTTGSSQVGVGGVFKAHIGIDRQHMKDDKRYVALSIKSTEMANPFTVTVIREGEQLPVSNVMISKSISQSTSK